MSVISDWAWARALEHTGGRPIEQRYITNIKKYAEKLGTQVSLYEDDDGKGLLCIFYETTGTSVECEITNLEQIKKESPDIVQVWLNSGECLYTQLTGGRGLSVINFNYCRDSSFRRLLPSIR